MPDLVDAFLQWKHKPHVPADPTVEVVEGFDVVAVYTHSE